MLQHAIGGVTRNIRARKISDLQSVVTPWGDSLQTKRSEVPELDMMSPEWDQAKPRLTLSDEAMLMTGPMKVAVEKCVATDCMCNFEHTEPCRTMRIRTFVVARVIAKMTLAFSGRALGFRPII